MPFQPYMMGAATLTIDAVNYEAEVGGAVFTPTNNSPVVFKAIGGQTYSKTPLADWTLDLTLAQDPATAASLANFLHDNEGQDVEAVLTPKDGGPTYTSTISITAASIGAADVSSVASAQVSMGATKPVRSV